MYWEYFKAVCLHKWYVFLECAKRGYIWRGLVHDMSKFLPVEFIPYAKFFYGNKEKNFDEWNLAYLHHTKLNKHHSQWWILRVEESRVVCLQMPEKYRVEMLCDWIGAGRAFGDNNVLKWYNDNKEKLYLHKKTRRLIELEIGYEEAPNARLA